MATGFTDFEKPWMLKKNNMILVTEPNRNWQIKQLNPLVPDVHQKVTQA